MGLNHELAWDCQGHECACSRQNHQEVSEPWSYPILEVRKRRRNQEKELSRDYDVPDHMDHSLF